MLDDAFANGKGKIQSAKGGIARFKGFNHAQGMKVMVKPKVKFFKRLVQSALTCMSEWRMADVMHQRQGFGQVFIQTERGSNGTGDLRYFHSVGKAATEVVRVAMGENLRFAGQTAKGAGMNDASPVALSAAHPNQKLRSPEEDAWIISEMRGCWKIPSPGAHARCRASSAPCLRRWGRHRLRANAHSS